MESPVKERGAFVVIPNTSQPFSVIRTVVAEEGIARSPTGGLNGGAIKSRRPNATNRNLALVVTQLAIGLPGEQSPRKSADDTRMNFSRVWQGLSNDLEALEKITQRSGIDIEGNAAGTGKGDRGG